VTLADSLYVGAVTIIARALSFLSILSKENLKYILFKVYRVKPMSQASKSEDLQSLDDRVAKYLEFQQEIDRSIFAGADFENFIFTVD
jgi:F0F1-type ATP synthase delta subunit